MSTSVLDSPVRSATQPRANTAARDSLPVAEPSLDGAPLGRTLVAAGLLTDSELQAALEHQAKNGSKLGESLLELGLVAGKQLLPFLRRQRGLPASRGDRVPPRVVDRKRRAFNLDGLGLPGDLLTQVKRLLTKPYGLLLICGPTGCGKTTTLYSALELIKSEQRNIVTVEDPVEYRTNLVNQLQISDAKDLTLPVALRSVLLRDPDVITVGEIRDAETAEVAVKAALTGHLVLSTLHATDSADAIVRLVDMGIEPYRVAASLIGVLAQRLVRRVCVKCRTAYCPDPELLQTVGCSRDGSRRFVRGEGCRACRGTGFAGRSGIFELFAVDEVARRLVSHGSDTMTLRNHLRDQGCRTLSEEGMRAAEECVTSLDEVLRVTAFE